MEVRKNTITASSNKQIYTKNNKEQESLSQTYLDHRIGDLLKDAIMVTNAFSQFQYTIQSLNQQYSSLKQKKQLAERLYLQSFKNEDLMSGFKKTCSMDNDLMNQTSTLSSPTSSKKSMKAFKPIVFNLNQQ